MLVTNTLNQENHGEVYGRVYYRSDTRPPEVVFKKGFSPKIKDFDNDWWKEAIKSRGYVNDRGIDDKAVDADPAVCICMSTKLESAAIFPLNNEDTYIYAIALPDFTQIKYVGPENGRVCLLRTKDTPTDSKEIVVDLNELQTVQTRNINEFFNTSTLSAGWPLHAYEALAYEVLPRSVICAIKCTRNNVEEELNSSSKLTSRACLDKKIMFVENVMKNLNFCEAQLVRVGSADQTHLRVMDYGPQKIQAIQEMMALEQKREYLTPNIYYGFGGKTF